MVGPKATLGQFDWSCMRAFFEVLLSFAFRPERTETGGPMPIVLAGAHEYI